MLDALERDFPGTRAAIECYYTATPLTYRDYTLTPEGAMYGMAKDVTKGIAGRVSYRTKIPNLLLVGQNINSHGILGVLVGSLTACTALLGEKTVTRQMHETCSPEGLPDPHSRPTTLIIGGGLGGLVSGALLAKEGHLVTVLEKNNTIGGGLQCFTRNGVLYPTGMHIFGGFQPGGQLNKICSYLGILDKLHLHATDSHSFDEIHSLGDNRIYLMPRGREAYTNYLCKQFPHEAEGIRAYVDAIYRLTQEEDLFYLREATHSPMDHSDQMLWPADKFIAHYIHDPELQTLLAYLSPLYAGVHGETPAITHALINVLHIEGTHQFIGGSQQLADALAEVIKQHGGSVLPDEEVDHVDVQPSHPHRTHPLGPPIRSRQLHQRRAPERAAADTAPQRLPSLIPSSATGGPLQLLCIQSIHQIQRQNLPLHQPSLLLHTKKGRQPVDPAMLTRPMASRNDVYDAPDPPTDRIRPNNDHYLSHAVGVGPPMGGNNRRTSWSILPQMETTMHREGPANAGVGPPGIQRLH